MKRKMKRSDGEEGSVVELDSEAGPNKNIGEDVRMRALKAVSEGGQKAETAPAPKAKKSAARTQPESDREEYSPWMRELRKKEATEAENQRESQALFNKKPVDTTSKEDKAKVAKAYVTAAKMQTSKPRGMKSGGKVSSASKRADGCAIRGKTRA